MILADACVYTRVRRELLDQKARDGSSLVYEAKRAWPGAEKLLLQAQRDSTVLPILLANAANRAVLLYYGALTEIAISESVTKYTVDRLRRIPGRHTPQELVLLSTGEHISSGYIRPYALCARPVFVSNSSFDAEDEWSLLPDEEIISEPLVEGRRIRVTVDAYERNREARRKCVEHHGCVCVVCGFDFAARYGELGQGFIHVHHVTPLAAVKDEYVVDPIEDLRPVCPNCHAMLHRAQPLLTVPELRSHLA